MTERTGKVATSKRFRDWSAYIFRLKAFEMYSPGYVTEEDICQIAALALLEAVSRGKFVLHPVIDTDDPIEIDRIHNARILRWLKTHVGFQYKSWIRSRLPKNFSEARGGNKMMGDSTFSETNYSDLTAETRVAVEILHITEPDFEIAREIFTLKGRMKALGIDEHKLFYICYHLNGTSFEEMARRHGGTSDKYRRLVRRALTSAGLDTLL
ncbi:hypothetical protein [Marinobacterium aestuarii]|nr:hypothetical protein [Marinobacterium aestuarii]